MRLAELSRLDIPEDRRGHYAKEVGDILGYVERLAKVDTVGVPEGGTAQHQQTWRVDVVSSVDDVTHDLIIQNFPDRQGSALRVPAVFEQPKG